MINMGSVISVIALIIGIFLALIGLFIISTGVLFFSIPYGTGIGAGIVLFGLLLLAGGAFLVYYSQEQKSRATPQISFAPLITPVSQPVASPTIVQPGVSSTRVLPEVMPRTQTVLAYLEAPNGRLIISSPTQQFYRRDFQGMVPPGLLETISQRVPQFTIYFRNGRFYIEDSSSTNGTLLNGRQIKGTGMQPLNDGDVISPAGTINLVFRVPM